MRQHQRGSHQHEPIGSSEATPQPIRRTDGKSVYRVQIRRPTKGININRYFGTKQAAEKYIRDIESAVDTGQPIIENVQVRIRFADALEHYLADPDALTTRNKRELKESVKRDRRIRLRWLVRKPDPQAKKIRERTGGDLGAVVPKNLTWQFIDERLTALKKEHGWSPASRYRYETPLSRFLDYCQRKGWAVNVVTNQERLE